MAAPQARQRRWIVADGFGAHLSDRRQPGSDGKRGAAEKIATADRVGHGFPSSRRYRRRIDRRFDVIDISILCSEGMTTKDAVSNSLPRLAFTARREGPDRLSAIDEEPIRNRSHSRVHTNSRLGIHVLSAGHTRGTDCT